MPSEHTSKLNYKKDMNILKLCYMLQNNCTISILATVHHQINRTKHKWSVYFPSGSWAHSSLSNGSTWVMSSWKFSRRRDTAGSRLEELSRSSVQASASSLLYLSMTAVYFLFLLPLSFLNLQNIIYTQICIDYRQLF